MNTYILYHQEMSQCVAKLKADSLDMYEVISGWNEENIKSAYTQLALLMENRATFSIIDPNGVAIAVELAIKKVTLHKDGRVIVEMFQLKIYRPQII